MILGLRIAGGVLVLVGGIRAVVVTAVRAERASGAAMRHQLEAEGIPTRARSFPTPSGGSPRCATAGVR